MKNAALFTAIVIAAASVVAQEPLLPPDTIRYLDP